MQTDRERGFAAAVSAIRTDAAMPPNSRLYLARASLFCDSKGRTRYGPVRYATDTGDSTGQQAIDWLTANGLVVNDTLDDGTECWRLVHYEWDAPTPRIGGYSPDAGQPRNGLPPAYGRPVDAVIPPKARGADTFKAPPGPWRTHVTQPDPREDTQP